MRLSSPNNYQHVFIILIGSLLANAAKCEEPSVVIPKGALAYGHFSITEIADSINVKLLKNLSRHVKTELAAVSFMQFGIDLTELQFATVIIPDAQTAFSKDSAVPAILFLLRFHNEINVDAIEKRWDKTPRDGTTFYTGKFDGDEATALMLSNRLLAVGDQTAIDWWLENRANQSVLQRVLENNERYPIHAGFNLSKLPKAVYTTFVPDDFQPLTKARIAAINVSLDDYITTNIALQFKHVIAARDALSTVQTMTNMLRTVNSALESLAKKELTQTNDSPRALGAAIGKLAAIRQAKFYCDQISVTQDKDNLQMTARVENDIATILIFAAAGLSNDDSTEE